MRKNPVAWLRLALLAAFMVLAPSATTPAAAQFSVKFDIGDNALDAANKLENAARALPEAAQILRDALLTGIANFRLLIKDTLHRLDEQQAQLLNDYGAALGMTGASIDDALTRAYILQQRTFDNLRLLSNALPTVLRFRPVLLFPTMEQGVVHADGAQFDRYPAFLARPDEAPFSVHPTSSIAFDIALARARLAGPTVRTPLNLRFVEQPFFLWRWFGAEAKEHAYQTTIYTLPDKLGTATITRTKQVPRSVREPWMSPTHKMRRETGHGELRSKQCYEIPEGFTRIEPGSMSYTYRANCDGGGVTTGVEGNPVTGRPQACSYIYHRGTRAACATVSDTETEVKATLIKEWKESVSQSESKDLFWDRDVAFDLPSTGDGENWSVVVETFDKAAIELSRSSPAKHLWFDVQLRPSDTRIVIRPYGPSGMPPWMGRSGTGQ